MLTKVGYVAHGKDIVVSLGCDCEDITPSRVHERHTPVYSSGIKIASNNNTAGSVPDLIAKGFDHPLIVSNIPVRNQIVAFTVTQNW